MPKLSLKAGKSKSNTDFIKNWNTASSCVEALTSQFIWSAPNEKGHSDHKMKKVLLSLLKNNEGVLLSSTAVCSPYFLCGLENHLFTIAKPELPKENEGSFIFKMVFINFFTSAFFLTVLYKDV